MSQSYTIAVHEDVADLFRMVAEQQGKPIEEVMSNCLSLTILALLDEFERQEAEGTL